MEANELMIGDLVSLNGDTIAKVISIAADGIYFEDSISEGVASFDRVLPIPLTADILEKNGFRVDGSGTNSRMCCTPFEEPGIRYNIYVGLKYKTIDVFAAHPEERKKGWRKSNRVYLEISGPFVHELQHALRLCGIDKEITL